MSIGLRNRRIDVLRGVSILLVLLHHYNIAYGLAGTSLGTLLTPAFVRAVVRNGNYGVTLFFVISGFLITSNALRRWGSLDHLRPSAFYALRVARIIPCLLLLLGIVALLGVAGLSLFQSRLPGTHQTVSPLLVYGAALSFWMNVLIVRLGWVNYPLGVLWSLSVEEVFYVTFPIVCLLLRRPCWIAIFWSAIVLIGPFYRATHQGDESGFLFAYFAAFDGIAVGCLTALVAARISNPNAIPGWVQVLVAVGMIALYLSAPIGITNVWGVTVMALGTAVLLLAANRHPSGPITGGRRLLQGVEWMGRLSYELYLFHLIVLALMRTFLPAEAVTGDWSLLLLTVFLIVSLVAAAGIGRFYAEPLNRAIRRWASRRVLLAAGTVSS